MSLASGKRLAQYHSRHDERGNTRMASKDKGGNKGSKKAATHTLKEKRQAKKAKQASKSK